MDAKTWRVAGSVALIMAVVLVFVAYRQYGSYRDRLIIVNLMIDGGVPRNDRAASGDKRPGVTYAPPTNVYVSLGLAAVSGIAGGICFVQARGKGKESGGSLRIS